jgi:hypothetical protein
MMVNRAMVHNRKEVTDFRVGTNKIGNLVCNWHVSDEPSLLDNRYIRFQIRITATTRVTSRDTKTTN